MSVTKTLTAHERKVARWFKQEGFLKPYVVVAAAKKADVSYATAAALIANETGNGKNIWHHDAVDTHGCYRKGAPMSKASYDCYKRHRGSGAGARDMQGVGPVGLTWWSIQDEADEAGGAHKPYYNMLTGFRVLKRNWEANGRNLRTAYRLYNGSGSAAESYADRAMAKRREYQGKLDRFLAKQVSPTVKRIYQVQADLRAIGFAQVGKIDGVAGPATRDAVREFKRMCVRHRFSRVDGSIGVKTAEVIHNHRDGRVSKHFAFREFASASSASCPGNGHIRGHRDLIRGLEEIRLNVGRPIGIRNGFRDPAKNSCVGGATHSQHLFGNAADIDPGLSVDQVRAFRAFSGIGFSRSTGRVLHVDVRHADPAHNFTRGTVANPTVWQYA